MRKSQAPSFKCAPKLQTDGEDHRVKHVIAPLHTVRSTDTVINLLLGECEDEGKAGFSVEKDTPQNGEASTEMASISSNESNSPPSCISLDSCRIFNVVYCKQSTRKHKIWEGDGILEVSDTHVTLKDEKGKVLGTTSRKKSKIIEEGSRLFIGNKEVEVIELLTQQSKATVQELSPLNKVVKKRKIGVCGKKFIIPVAHSLDKSISEFTLPEPNAEHQWYFNENNLPITQVCLDSNLARNLRKHQFSGITFMYECIMGFKAKNINGAILADEMGLGKTLQTIALIWTLLKHGPYGNQPVVKKVLVVTPSSLTMNWYNEFIKWLGREKLVPFVVDSKNKPQNMRSPVMIISYEMFVRCFDDIKEIAFDLLVCDEGHRLKNSGIRTTQLLRQLGCPKRILLTGTPIQNDLKEFYTLIDFVCPNILGSPADFRRCFEEPILASRQPSANEETVLAGEELASELNRKTSLFVLRRTKEILNNYLPSKVEVVIFCKPTDIQVKIYNHLINSLVENGENLFGFSDSHLHLSVINWLKKVCNHPGLLWRKDFDEDKEDILLSKLSNEFISVRTHSDTKTSSKLMIVFNFLHEMRQRFPKERVVIVSNSTQTLDLLEEKLKELNYSTCRLDGSVPAAQRNRIVEGFNRWNSSTFVFLLSLKAGGVGLNLTGASRLILFDSDWNPANDLQAMSRIWRDGQKHSVYIYRLLTSGTIEEKIYQRQINKQGLCEGIVDPHKANSIRIEQEEMKNIFSYCNDPNGCSTHDSLSCKCFKTGDIPMIEEEERTCQLMRQSNSCLKINQLFHWEHHGSPVSSSLLSELCMSGSKDMINFVFRNCKR